MDQVHGIKLSDDIPTVLKRPMTNEDLLQFRDALHKSYNPKNEPVGIQKKDFKVVQDERFLYFQLKTGKNDTKGEPICKVVFKLRKWDPAAQAAAK